MKLIINGKEETLKNTQLSVKEILQQSEVQNIEMVTVQLNGSFVPNDQFETTLLAENDTIDFLYFMGGGSK